MPACWHSSETGTFSNKCLFNRATFSWGVKCLRTSLIEGVSYKGCLHNPIGATFQFQLRRYRFAAPRVFVLDPCCGTGTYVMEVLKRIAETLKQKGEDALLAQDLKEAAM